MLLAPVLPELFMLKKVRFIFGNLQAMIPYKLEVRWDLGINVNGYLCVRCSNMKH